jgi:hypothetical protein
MAADSAGNLYFSDGERHVIGRIDAASGLLTTVYGGSPAISPQRLALLDDAHLLFTAEGAHQVFHLDLTAGSVEPIAGTGVAGFAGDGGAPLLAQLDLPQALAVDGQARVLTLDFGNLRLRRIAIGPDVSIDDVQVTEGDQGSQMALFPVHLASPSSSDLILAYRTVDDTAIAGSDYDAGLRRGHRLGHDPGRGNLGHDRGAGPRRPRAGARRVFCRRALSHAGGSAP